MRQIERDFLRILEKHGRTAALCSADAETPFKAFLQPLRYKNKLYLSTVSTELSYNNTRKFLLICSADIDINSADGYEAIIRTDDGIEYCNDHSEIVYDGDNPLYCWSIVHRVK